MHDGAEVEIDAVDRSSFHIALSFEAVFLCNTGALAKFFGVVPVGFGFLKRILVADDVGACVL